MNDTIHQFNSIGEQYWRSMSFVSKVAAVLVGAILLLSGLMMGLFIFATALAIAITLYLQSLLARKKKKTDHEFVGPDRID